MGDGDFLGRTILTAEAFYPKGMQKCDIPLSDAGSIGASIKMQIIVQEREEDPPNIWDAFTAYDAPVIDEVEAELARMEAEEKAEEEKRKKKEEKRAKKDKKNKKADDEEEWDMGPAPEAD